MCICQIVELKRGSREVRPGPRAGCGRPLAVSHAGGRASNGMLEDEATEGRDRGLGGVLIVVTPVGRRRPGTVAVGPIGGGHRRDNDGA